MKNYDERLTEKLKRGDREAQRELYNRHSSALMAISMRYMGERSSAEDTLHDAFIKIFTSISKFQYRGEGSLRAWMSRIVVNQALEELRQRERITTTSLDERLTARETAREIEIEVSSEVSRVPQHIVQRFITELPDGYRTVFNLFCIEGYSHREIARELKINEKSSSSQLLRAKRMLAMKIKSYLDTNE